MVRAAAIATEVLIRRRAQEEAESGESNLTRIVAGILFKEFSEQGNFNYQIRLGVETFELESRTKEMRMISTKDINFYLTFHLLTLCLGLILLSRHHFLL